MAVATLVGACGARTTIDVERDSDGGRRDAGADADALVREASTDADAAPDVFREAATGKPCSRDSDCSDSIDCTDDTCRDGRCANDPDDAKCPVSYACEPGVGCQARAWALATKRGASGNFLWDIRLPSGRGTEIPISGNGDSTDIALRPTGELVGVHWDQFIAIEQKAGTWVMERKIGPAFTITISALDFATDGRLYAGARDRLYRYTATLGDREEIAAYPEGYRSSGDLAVLQDRVLATALTPAGGSDSLVEFDVPAGTSRVIGLIGFSCVHGLAAFGGSLYGFTCWGDVLKIDPSTGAGSVIVKHDSADFLGATAR